MRPSKYACCLCLRRTTDAEAMFHYRGVRTSYCVPCGEQRPVGAYYAIDEALERAQRQERKALKTANRRRGKKSTTRVRRPLTLEGRFQSYQKGAKVRELDFALDLSQFSALVAKPCDYCGEQEKPRGIDRVDNEVGYLWENCVACCSACNTSKRDLPVAVWVAHMAKILAHMGK